MPFATRRRLKLNAQRCPLAFQLRNFYIEPMTKADVIAALERHRDLLHSFGGMHAAVFGSLARGDARSDSDVDLLVRLTPARRTVFDLVGLEQAIAEPIPGKVHVAIEDQLKPALRDSVHTDASYAF